MKGFEFVTKCDNQVLTSEDKLENDKVKRLLDQFHKNNNGQIKGTSLPTAMKILHGIELPDNSNKAMAALKNASNYHAILGKLNRCTNPNCKDLFINAYEGKKDEEKLWYINGDKTKGARPHYHCLGNGNQLCLPWFKKKQTVWKPQIFLRHLLAHREHGTIQTKQ